MQVGGLDALPLGLLQLRGTRLGGEEAWTEL